MSQHLFDSLLTSLFRAKQEMEAFKFSVFVLPILQTVGALSSGFSTARDSEGSIVGEAAPSVTGIPSSPPCKPTLVLNGVSEDRFNEPDTPFTIRLSCNSLDTGLHAVFLATGSEDEFFGLGRALNDTQIAPNGITVTGFGPGIKPITIIARDDRGNSLFGSFALFFGSPSLPVKVVGEDGKPVLSTDATAQAFAAVEQSGVTDLSGAVGMTDLLALYAKLRASAADKTVSAVSAIPSSSFATLALLHPPHPVRRSNVVGRGPYPGMRDSHTRCEANAGSAICLPTCQSPPPKSCDFYTQCAEQTLHCGPEGYPLQYGAKNCRRFVVRLDSFSPEGQAWIWKVMLCLQRDLVQPISATGATCESVKNEAFQSHPRCYVDSGFCDLPLRDLVQVVATVKSDLLQGPAIEQALKVGKGCVRRFASEVKKEVGELRKTTGGANTTARSAVIAILEDVNAYLEKLSPLYRT